ncbi:hypothetical protein WA026_006961 [Henosepilachna vigintioctopunctata]|uniref:ACB domain-containing protein n=1 Tax=Henosepilachna vigintioctopunctata TaxID=420089 RepID=A0AAW1V840_9CUCU
MSNTLDHLKISEKVTNALQSGNFSYALTLVNDNRYYEDFIKSSWEILPLVTKNLTSTQEDDNIHNFKYCEDIIHKIAEKCNPEEALLQFIEEVEESKDDTQFKALLCPMLKVLQRIPNNRLNSLAWCLNSIQTYINKIDVSNKYHKSITWEEVFRIELLYEDVIRFYDFLSPFYTNLLQTNEECRIVLTKYLIELLGNPIGYLDMSNSYEISKTRKITEYLVEKILSVCSDPFNVFNFDNLKPTEFSYGIFLYLILVEKLKYDLIPKVYGKCYIFYSSLKYIVTILRSKEKFVLGKGLILVESILQNKFKLSYLVLELEINKEFVRVLENIIIFNEVEEYRKQGFRIFKLYLNSFEVKGQYLLLYNLVRTIQHSGLAGFVIMQYKEVLVDLQRSQNEHIDIFQRNKYSFINQCIVVTEDEYNTIDVADRVVSVLNLMRFVVLQEKPQNITHFRKIACIWRHKYLNFLEVLLEKRKKFFKESKHEIEHNYMTKSNVNISVLGESTLEISNSEKLRNIEFHITALDMIETVHNTHSHLTSSVLTSSQLQLLFLNMSLDERFNKSAEEVKNLKSKPSDQDLLELYGLFKQATVGNNTTSRPGLLDLKGKAKWDSWTSKKDLDQDAAKEQYIAKVESLISSIGKN